MLDRSHASRDDLIKAVLAQRDQIADLAQRLAWQADDLAIQRATIARLTEQLGEVLGAGEEPPAADPDDGARPTAMPGLKPTTATARPARSGSAAPTASPAGG